MTDNQGRARERLYGKYVSSHLPHVEEGELDARRLGGVHWKLYGRDIPADRTCKILELGCGHGAFLASLQRRGYTSVEGIDRSPEQVALARQRGLHVEEGDVFDFLQGVGSEYDVIIAIDLLEHLSVGEVLDLAEHVHRALRPGGVFVFQSPCAEGPFGARYRYSDLTHETAFTARSARQLLRLTGFDDIQLRPVRPLVRSVPSALRYVVWRAGDFVFRVLLAAETGERSDVILTQNLIARGRKPHAG